MEILEGISFQLSSNRNPNNALLKTKEGIPIQKKNYQWFGTYKTGAGCTNYSTNKTSNVFIVFYITYKIMCPYLKAGLDK